MWLQIVPVETLQAAAVCVCVCVCVCVRAHLQSERCWGQGHLAEVVAPRQSKGHLASTHLLTASLPRAVPPQALTAQVEHVLTHKTRPLVVYVCQLESSTVSFSCYRFASCHDPPPNLLAHHSVL